MKGDFTRFTHDPAKRYKAVLRQQGRADLDADWNENQHIDDYREETTNVDVIGVTGFPKGTSFQVSALADGSVQVQPGRAYVDGILAELHGTNPIDYDDQPDLPSPPPINADSGRRDLVFLDVWERHITAHQDPEIKEVALGGADTCTRVQVVAQIRILQNIADEITCASPLEDWAPAPSGGRLTTSLDTPAIPPDPCSPLPGSAFRGLENRLYRVEIHQAGNLGAATFKWSRDNGAVTFGIRQFRPNEPANVELTRLGRDQILSLKTGSFAEVVSDETDLMGTAGTFTSVASDPDLATRVVTFNDDVDSHDGQPHPIVRRWDGDLEATAGPAFELEDGINVSFSGTNFRVGDYWMFTARTADIGGLEILTNAEPHGIRHHYAKLAIIEWVENPQGGFNPVVVDCRPQFPPLTDIDAEDVGFESDVCDFGPEVKTVKDALEQLCSEEHECCTLVAVPGPGWESIFDEIAAGQDAAICFRVGVYPINTAQPKIVAGKGHLKLTGAGPGTQIIANAGEVALIFQNCDSVTVRDLHARATQSTTGNDLNGVLTFRNCGKVSLDSLDVDCLQGVTRRATCLTIRNDQPVGANAGLAEVENCHLHVGNQQVGLLVVNARRSVIRNNRIRVKPAPANFFNLQVQDKATRSAMMSALASGITFRTPPKPAPPPPPPPPPPTDGRPTPPKSRFKRIVPREANFKLAIGDRELRFATDSKMEKSWQQLLIARPPQATDEKAVIEHVRGLAEQAILGQIQAVGGIQDVITDIRIQNAAAMSQGITVAGRVLDEAVITGNTIIGASQGIHVGLSHHDPPRTNPDRGERVHISGNQVHIAAVVGATRSRHGIFVGNANSIVVRENYTTLTRFAGMLEANIDGIRLFGYFGRYINVRENHIDRFHTGVQVTVRGEPADNPMWQVYDNFTANADQSVVKNHSSVKTQGNQS